MIQLEDLQYNGLRIYADKDGFSYGQDAVLLANFARPAPDDRCLDLCAGGGILSILINGKTGAAFTAIELQQSAADMMRESVILNGQQDSISVICADIRALEGIIPREGFSCAVCNPPYYSGGTKSPDPARALSVHQEECTIADVALCCKKYLKNGGKLWLCYPAERLAECFAALVNNGIEPKRVRLIEGRKGPYLALIQARKGGHTGIIWENTAAEEI